MPNPVVFAAPADVELDPAPIPPDWIIEGNPQARSKRLAASADGTSTIMAWSCTAGRFKWHYTVDETIHLISGEVFVTDENDNVRRVGPGDMVFFPAGAVSTWYIPDHVRKLAVCRHAMPRFAGFAVRAFSKLIGIVTGVDGGGALDSGPVADIDAKRVHKAA
ncbi:MAG TPA: cupin domain-containing protein [Xanthobacteraceae bacterium]|nr:cupin domain-containing protein [Xanthobacteraceae bacterium]